MTILTEAIGDILDNYADVVEGGNAYAGGTVYRGIPSKRSYDRRLVSGENAGGGSTTTATLAGITAAIGGELVRSDAPAYFLLCTAQNSGTLNTGAARPVTGHDGTDTFTVAPAFTEAVASGDTFSVVEGFKRALDGKDIEAEGTLDIGGHDRVFSIAMTPGKRMDWGGDGTEVWDGELKIRVRILKKNREQTARKSVLENLQNILSIMELEDLRGSYTQSLSAMDSEPEIETDDQIKVVGVAKFRIIYRFNADYK